MRKVLVLAAAMILIVGACGGNDAADEGSDVAGAPVVADGEKVFINTCLACHGKGGAGIEGLGKPMPGSEFITSLSDAELVAFLKEGRGTDHPDNTTGIDMPARGGRDLSEQDLVDVVAYIRTLG